MMTGDFKKRMGSIEVDVRVSEETKATVDCQELMRMVLHHGASELAEEIIRAGATELTETKSGFHIELVCMVDKDSRMEVVERITTAARDARRDALTEAAACAKARAIDHKSPASVATASFALERLAERLLRMAEER